MKTNPDIVLLQRLNVWNKWIDEVNHIDAVRSVFRSEALSASLSLMLRPKPRFDLYRQLKRSEMPLARMLFADVSDYLHGLLHFVARWPSLGIRAKYKRIKLAIATRLILPNRGLLWLAQRFGRFKNVETAWAPDRRDAA
jgi:hypothetical protein